MGTAIKKAVINSVLWVPVDPEAERDDYYPEDCESDVARLTRVSRRSAALLHGQRVPGSEGDDRCLCTMQ